MLAWELGMGLWHGSVLGQVAAGLRARGHEIVLAVADPVGTFPVLRGLDAPVLQAPRLPALPTLADELERPVVSFADILGGTGFAEIDHLLPLVRAWDGLTDLVRPDVLVCDHAPSLQLAAYGTLPIVEVGLGFTIPPAQGERFPALRPGTARWREEHLLAVIREVQRQRRRPAPPTVPALYASAARLVCTLPDLDPYALHGDRDYAGPLGGHSPPAPPAPSPRFFAYLAAEHPRIGTLITGLVRSGIPGSFYLRGAPARMREELRRRGVELHDRPADVDVALRGAAVAVHHGGAGLTQHVAAAGRPQLLVPRHLEQQLNAMAVVARGAGEILPPDADPLAVGKALRRLGTAPDAAAAARRWSERIGSRGRPDPIRRVVDAVEGAGAS